MDIRAVAFDMDDTLLRDDRTISDYTISVLRKAAGQGIRIIPASGRARDSMKPFVDQIGCASCYIACNGAEIWSPDHTLLHGVSLDVPTLLECARLADDYDAYAQVYEGGEFFYSQEGHWNREYERSSMLRGVYVGRLTDWITKPSSKLLMMAEPEQIRVMYEDARSRFGDRVQVTCSKPWFLEINPKEAAKGLALGRAGELFGFTLAQSAAFGDSLNDMNMLTAAGLGVAMANAWPEVKAQIPTVCLSNMEDGVARYIEEHFL